MRRMASGRRGFSAALTALCLVATLAPTGAAGGSPSSGPVPLSATPLFENYSAFTGLSGNLSINNQTRADTEIFRGFLNGGRGACWIDYDGDGDDDLYLVGPGASQMFRHDGGWNFTDVTNQTGLWAAGYGMACGSADLDGDGDEDIWATDYAYGDRVFSNNGNGTFTNVTASSGVTNASPHTGIAFGDFDNDGLLDVVVTSYNRYQDLVYRNLGNMTFEERWASSKLYDTDWGFQPLIFDYDLDGDVDLYTVNDFGPDRLWRNDGNWTFTDVSNALGANDPGGGMGGDVADLDHNGSLEFYIGNYNQNGLWVWNGTGYVNRAAEAGVDNASTAWATLFFDYDNDGWDDLFVVNGAVDAQSVIWQSNVLYHNLGGMRFEDVSNGSGVNSAEIGRSAAAADVDGDGRVDLYETNVNSPNEMLRNVAPSTNRWIGLRLQGTVSNPEGVGALITLKAGNLTQVKPVLVGTGYLSTNSKVQHFGLGQNDLVDSVEIRWPSGLVQTLTSLPVNGTIVVSEEDLEAPQAVAGDVSGLRGLPIGLNGSASSDNVRIVAWNWSVDDNGTPRRATGKLASVALYTAGNFTGTLEVADLFGNTATAVFNVSVGANAGAWAEAGPDFAVDEGVAHEFAAGGGTSETPDFEGTSNFTWSFSEWGTAHVLTGARPNYTFRQVGVVEVRLHVVDVAAHTADDWVNVTVTDVTAPNISWVVPSAVDEDVVVPLSATTTTDNDPSFPAGAMAQWTYLSGSGIVTRTGFTANTTFPDPGTVTITVRVTDAAGNVAARMFNVTVRDTTRPVASAGGDRTAVPGETVLFSANLSTDNAGDFMEKGNFTWTLDLPGGAVALFGPEQHFVFAFPGTFRVDLAVLDPSGNAAAAAASFNVTVADNEAPTPSGGGNRFVAVGLPTMLDASGSTDNDPTFLSTGAFSWEFQDGGVRQVLTGLRVNYTFARVGDYDVRLSARDGAGNAARILFTLTVGDGTPPVIVAEPLPANLSQGRSLVLNASGTHDDVGLASVIWHVTGPYGFDVFTSTSSAIVPVGLPGDYHATVIATDTTGNVATATFDVHVTVAQPGPTGNGTGTGDGNGNGSGNTSAPTPTSLALPSAVLIIGGGLGVVGALALRRSRRGKGGEPPQAG